MIPPPPPNIVVKTPQEYQNYSHIVFRALHIQLFSGGVLHVAHNKTKTQTHEIIKSNYNNESENQNQPRKQKNKRKAWPTLCYETPQSPQTQPTPPTDLYIHHISCSVLHAVPYVAAAVSCYALSFHAPPFSSAPFQMPRPLVDVRIVMHSSTSWLCTEYCTDKRASCKTISFDISLFKFALSSPQQLRYL